ncbi:MAG: thiol reductant ABC exporter subunit CydC [Varibaculum sp.]|nr:thiol reductant ABC exporter subunit CydC [Varibaculum sp.]
MKLLLDLFWWPMRFFLTKSEIRALRSTIRLLRIKPGQFALAVLLGVLGLGAAIALTATSAWLIARASERPPFLFLEVAVVCVRLFGISKAVMRYLERLASHRVALNGLSTLRYGIYRLLAEKDTAKIAGLRRGDLLERTGADVDALGDVVVKSLLPIVTTAIVGIFSVIGIAFVDVFSAIVLMISLIIAGYVAPLLAARAARLAEHANRGARIGISTRTMNITDGGAEIQVFGTSEKIFDELADYEAELQRTKNISAIPAAWASTIDILAMGLAVLGAIYFGSQGVVDGSIANILLAVLAITPLACFEGTAQLGTAAMQLTRSAIASEQIMDLLSGADEHPSRTLADATTTNGDQNTDVRLVAEDLAIGWPDGPVLARGLNLELAAGGQLAIIGRSGIGKTTLLLTLAGLIPPKAGSVTIGGVPLVDCPRDEVSRFVNVVPEDAHVFETTVLENLRVGNPALSAQQAQDALERCGMSAWLASLPDGLDTMLGTGGANISGGERRRLLLARALGGEAPLLLLDEPGEHIDAAMADSLTHDLLAQYPERGVLIVTHRLSGIPKDTRVLQLGESASDPNLAEIIADGTHAELSENNEGYRWALQQERWESEVSV